MPDSVWVISSYPSVSLRWHPSTWVSDPIDSSYGSTICSILLLFIHYIVRSFGVRSFPPPNITVYNNSVVFRRKGRGIEVRLDIVVRDNKEKDDMLKQMINKTTYSVFMMYIRATHTVVRRTFNFVLPIRPARLFLLRPCLTPIAALYHYCIQRDFYSYTGKKNKICFMEMKSEVRVKFYLGCFVLNSIRVCRHCVWLF